MELRERLDIVRKDYAPSGKLTDLHTLLYGDDPNPKVSYFSLQKYHSTERKPSLSYLKRLHEVLGIRLEWLLTGQKPITVTEALLPVEPLYLVGAPEPERTEEAGKRFEKELREGFGEYFKLTATTHVDLQNLLMRYVYQSCPTRPATLPLGKRVEFIVKVGRDLVDRWTERGSRLPYDSPEFSTYAKARILSWLLLWAPVQDQEDTNA